MLVRSTSSSLASGLDDGEAELLRERVVAGGVGRDECRAVATLSFRLPILPAKRFAFLPAALCLAKLPTSVRRVHFGLPLFDSVTGTQLPATLRPATFSGSPARRRRII